MSCAYFVSDLHLSETVGADAAVFLRFLERLRVLAEHRAQEAPSELFLVGDIFDLWVGDHDYFRLKFASVSEAVEKLVKLGVEVHFFEGNHDFHLRAFWAERLGVQVHSEAAYFELAGRVVRVEHGDLINPDDHGYLFLRWLLRTQVMRFMALNLPAKTVAKIGERASRASREYTSTSKGLPEDAIRAMIRAHAEEAYKEKPFDLIITGHVHVVDDVVFPVSGLEIRSVNLGSWHDKRRAFVLSEERAELIDLTASFS